MRIAFLRAAAACKTCLALQINRCRMARNTRGSAWLRWNAEVHYSGGAMHLQNKRADKLTQPVSERQVRLEAFGMLAVSSALSPGQTAKGEVRQEFTI